MVRKLIPYKVNGMISEDLSFGKSKHKVPCYNDIDEEQPPKFEWVEECIIDKEIQDSIVSRGFEYLVGCTCKDNCTPINSNCSCLNEMNKTYGYDSNKRIIVPVGTVIYECNMKCHCSINCKNRVVQKGSQYKFEVFKTVDRGWGVRSPQKISKGTFVCEYTGQIIDNQKAEELGIKYDAQRCSYLFDLDVESNNEDCLTIDAMNYGNIARFFNHSCSPNLQNYSIFTNHWDKRRPQIAFFATRDILPYEELTFDYKYKKDKCLIPCSCDSPLCKIWLL